jgi:uncharacterized membrane-anchored protein
MNARLLFGGLVLTLGVANWAIVQKERLISGGDVVLLELAPVDPRSLIQGDYMRLDYAVTRAIGVQGDWSHDGAVVVQLGRDGVATYVRRHETGQPLATDERLLRYRKRGNRVRVATDAYFFQEGSARKYTAARYGELRVDDDGSSVLVGLRDGNRTPIR